MTNLNNVTVDTVFENFKVMGATQVVEAEVSTMLDTTKLSELTLQSQQEVVTEVAELNKAIKAITGKVSEIVTRSKKNSNVEDEALKSEFQGTQEQLVDLGWEFVGLETYMTLRAKALLQVLMGEIWKTVITAKHAFEPEEQTVFDGIKLYTFTDKLGMAQ